jgi:hypothetical protein
LAEPGGEPAQGALAAPVAALPQFGVQPFGAARAVIPALAQIGQVRIEEARLGQAGARNQLVCGGGGGIAPDLMPR